MKYVGNTALSPQIQERIQNTFEQTLSLAQEGNRQEALLGCDFILRLDPLFEPARKLQKRLDNGDGPIDVSDLTGEQQGSSEAAEPDLSAPVDIGELIGEDAFSAEAAEPAIAITPAEQAPTADSLAGRLAMLFEQRSFQDLLSLAMENQDRVTADADLRRLVNDASECLEAEPYVRNFLQSARSAKDQGDLEGANAFLQKARELDSSHPDLLALEADLRPSSRVEAPAPVVEIPPLVETPPLVDDDAGEAVDELFAIADATFAGDETEKGDARESETPGADSMTSIPSLDAEPSARLDSESEQRIAALLKEGQEAFEEGQYQTAIDAWSRIFLIDIDHAEASRRIELARKLKAEVERQIEETFHEGISLLEAGAEDKAREAFERLLEMQPNHLGARDYLEKLSSGDLTASTPIPDLTPVDQSAAQTSVPPESLDEVDLAPPTPQFKPLQGDLAPEEVTAIPEARPARGRSFLFIGTAVLLLVLAIGWFVYSKWDRFFPGSAGSEDTAQPQSRIDPIERARELHEAGNTAMAISVLRRLPPGHDQYSEALALITMWEEGGQAAEVEAEQISEADLARRAELVARAERVADSGRNLLALNLLDEASEIGPLTEEEVALQTRTEQALELLADERALFEQGDWEYALPSLWRQHELDKTNQDVVQLIVDSYYNLGLRDLQRGDAKAALEKFEEAQALSDGNGELDRMVEFAGAYASRPADMLFRIFVKYQKFR